MKTWQWIAIGVAVVVIFIIIEQETNKPPTTGYLNPATNNLAAAGVGLGGLLAGIFATSTKVSAPSAGNIPAGTNGIWDPTGSAAAPPVNRSDPFSLGTLSYSQGNGGSNVGGGLTGAQATNDPLGVGQLTAPNFDIGTGGADFSN